MSYTYILICLVSAIAKLEAARILAVIPSASISHQIVFRPLTQELARRGHDVVVITTDPAFPKGQSPENLTEIDVHDITYTTWSSELRKVAVGDNSDMNVQIKMFLRIYIKILEQQMNNNEVQELITDKNMRFDLILVEACARPSLIFSHIFKAPVIQMSSFGTMLGTNSIMGAPNHPLYQPIVVRQRIYNLTIWEKIREIYRQFIFEYINYEHMFKEDVVLKRIFGPDTPTIGELLNNVQMVFLNVHSIWNDNSPVPPGVIYIGGIHQQPAKELPQELLTYLDSSENGTIYMSFGTNVHPSILPPHTIKMMVKVFSELPYDVIWKWDTELPETSKNIKVFKWLPQTDLLRHPKLKLFITQGGLQSTDEAIASAVPLVGIPVLADQWYNVEKYVRLGIGQQLDLGTFTEEEFRNAITTVIETRSYRDNILRLRTLFRDQPQSPLERAIWWTEYILRHNGARHLRSPAANMSWVEYFEVKLVFTCLTCFLIIITVIAVTLVRIKQYIFRNKFLNFKLKRS